MTGPPLLPWSVRIELIAAAKAVSLCTHPLTTLASVSTDIPEPLSWTAVNARGDIHEGSKIENDRMN